MSICRLYQVFLVAAGIFIPSVTHAQPIAVLSVKDHPFAKDGRVTLTLASGTTITIPETDINGALTTMVIEVLSKNAPARALPPVAAVPSTAEAQGGIRSQCADEWPTDFTMRAHCETQQRQGLLALQSRAMLTKDHQTIRTSCGADWPGDFVMRNHCEEQQLKALNSLR